MMCCYKQAYVDLRKAVRELLALRYKVNQQGLATEKDFLQGQTNLESLAKQVAYYPGEDDEEAEESKEGNREKA